MNNSTNVKTVSLRFTDKEFEDLIKICPRGITVGVYLKNVALQLIKIRNKDSKLFSYTPIKK